MSTIWFDAHLDLAYLAVCGRDMLAPLPSVSLDPEPRAHAPARAEAAGARDLPPHPPAAVTLPALADANVRLALGTVFTEPGGAGPDGYPARDPERAAAVGRAQLEVYLSWRDRGLVTLDLPRRLRAASDAAAHTAPAANRAAPRAPDAQAAALRDRLARLPSSPALHLGILVENADPIRSPDELPWWKQHGVVAVGMAWWKSSRYAGGNAGDDRPGGLGLSPLGRDLARAMDDLGIVHDLSHLSDRASDELLELTQRPIIASHSNCRALLDPGNMRHLRDDVIREIARRGGVVGLNLVSAFLNPACRESGRASIADCVRHVEHVCALAGHRLAVGLGSDMDGGISALKLPRHLNHPAHLGRLLDALADRGFSDDDRFNFAAGNWARFFAALAPTP